MDEERKRYINSILSAYVQVTPWLIMGLLGARVITAQESKELIRRLFVDKDWWPPDGPSASGGGAGSGGGGGAEGGNTSEFFVSDTTLAVFITALLVGLIAAHIVKGSRQQTA